MPTYGYQCTQCQHEFSVFQNMKDDPITTCPECGGAVKRLLYPVGIVFKGSGWYVNDSRKPEKSESGSAAPTEAKAGDTAPGGTTDSKPAESKPSDSKPTAPTTPAGKEAAPAK